MSYLQQQMNFLKYDKRLLEINLKNGTITEEEYSSHLNNLADESHKAEKVDLEGDSDKMTETMNGESHPAEPAQQPQPQQDQGYTPPQNIKPDPFGSGY